MEKKNSQNTATRGLETVAITDCTNNQQWTRYRSRQAHGFAAEDANALHDMLHGNKVDKVGVDNIKNGADRIVNNNISIQTKYCDTATKSVNAAFENGQFRYEGMKLEVPKEQYDEAVRLMESRIRNGQVSGVSDPNMAKQIVVKGHCTYNEAVRIAKAGNWDSIKFDAKTQSVSCAFACGLSGVVGYATALKNGATQKEALKYAGVQAAKSGASTLVSGVAAQQLLRTEVGRNMAAFATKAIKPVIQSAMRTEFGKAVLSKTASAVAKTSVQGAAATNVLTKALRTNAVVGTVTFAVTTIPDVVKLCNGKISGRQFAENTTSNAAGIGGGWAGASAGAALGTAICPGVGTVIGGIIGGLGGGMGASACVRKIFSWF